MLGLSTLNLQLSRGHAVRLMLAIRTLMEIGRERLDSR